MVLNIGDKAPDFELVDTELKFRKLDEFKGKKVVIYFYPKDDTPGCTKEACSIRDNYDDFTNQDIIVFGISYDNSNTHQRFIQKYKLPFNLLSDSDKTVSQLCGTKGAFFPMRKTFLIDEKGKLQSLFDEELSNARRQDLQDVYIPNGAIYIFQIKEFIKRNCFPSNGSIPFIMKEEDSIDIDEKEDLIKAEKILRTKNA